MRILGLTDGQTSGAAVIEDGRILAAVNEERIVRIKLARGFPWKAIEEVLRLSNTRAHEIKAVAVANINIEFRKEVTDWPGWFEARGEDADLHSAFFNIAGRYGHIADRVPSLKRAYYALRSPAYASRRRQICQILSREYGIDAPVRFAEHGFSGTIVPAGPGSIAVIGTGDADLEQITERVLAAVDWGRD